MAAFCQHSGSVLQSISMYFLWQCTTFLLIVLSWQCSAIFSLYFIWQRIAVISLYFIWQCTAILLIVVPIAVHCKLFTVLPVAVHCSSFCCTFYGSTLQSFSLYFLWQCTAVLIIVFSIAAGLLTVLPGSAVTTWPSAAFFATCRISFPKVLKLFQLLPANFDVDATQTWP